MTYRLLVRRQAKLDLRQAARWYEERHPGLGRELVAQVEAILDRITNNPNQYQVAYRNIRRAIVQRFPYGVFFRIEDSDILVLAIVHLQREPPVWQQRR